MTINTNNYEEYFLLYTDRELNADECQMVESFVRQHPDLEKELETLKQTIAIPPVVVFENKNSLFRKEKKRRLYPMYWMRIAATLFVLLAGAWILFMTGKPLKNDGSLNPLKKTALNQPAVKSKNHTPAAIESQHPASISKTESVTTTSATNHLALAQNHKQDLPSAKHPPESRSKQNTKVQGIQYPGTDEVKTDEVKTRALQNLAKQDQVRTPALPDPAKQNDVKTSSLPDLSKQNDVKTLALPDLAKQNEIPETPIPVSNPSTPLRFASAGNAPNPPSLKLPRPNPSTINHQPSTEEDPTSILIFNKPISGFLKKLTARSSGTDATADNLRRRVRVSVFQFSMSK